MDGEWILPIKPTACLPETTALSDRFIQLFPEFKKLSNNVLQLSLISSILTTCQDFVVEQVRALSAKLKTKCWYCPSTWTARAYNLLRLGYPELAVGDAYKATMLMTAYEDKDSPMGTTLKEQVTQQLIRQTTESPVPASDPSARFTNGVRIFEDYANYTSDRAAIVLAQALFVANCFVECREHLNSHKTKRMFGNGKFEKMKELVERAIILEDTARARDGDYLSDTDLDAQEARRSGFIIPQTYPWILPFLERESYTLGLIRRKMNFDSKEKCLLVDSELLDEVALNDEAEMKAGMIGIKASRSCRRGELLLDEDTFISGLDDRTGRCYCCGALLGGVQLIGTECCNARFCNERCRKSTDSFHRILCPQTEILMSVPKIILKQDNVTPDTLAYNELLHRIFAYIQSDRTVHALKLPVINAMAPAFRSRDPVRFSFANDIKRPMAMLLLLGTELFKDYDLDTWVIQNITARVGNNVRAFTDDAGRYHLAINPCYAFFNHSCRPNLRAHRHASGSSRLLVYADRNISKDEELFVSYVDEAKLNVPYAERQVLLKSWVGSDCRCPRCKDELESMTRVNEEVKFLLAPLNIGQEDSTADDNDDADDDDAGVWSNRYVTDDTLNEDHPTMESLERNRPIYEQHLKPLDFENDINCGESPLRGKGKSLRD